VPGGTAGATFDIARDGWIFLRTGPRDGNAATFTLVANWPRLLEGPVVAVASSDAAFVIDVLGDVVVASRVRAYVGVQNLTDRSYVVARQPAGARPGLPRTLMVGVRLQIGS